MVDLHEAHDESMGDAKGIEANRLQHPERNWLLTVVQGNSELGELKCGNNRLQQLLGEQCWKLSKLEDDEEEIVELQCDAVQHMTLAGKPKKIIAWLKELPGPTDETTARQLVTTARPRIAMRS